MISIPPHEVKIYLEHGRSPYLAAPILGQPRASTRVLLHVNRSSSGEPVPGSTGCLFLPVGILLLLWCLFAGVKEVRYRSSGARAMAHVTYTWTTAGKNPRTRSEYDFQVNGRTYSGTGGSHGTGEDIPIFYLPSNPKENRDPADGDTAFWPVAFFGAFALFLIGAGIYLIRNDTELLND